MRVQLRVPGAELSLHVLLQLYLAAVCATETHMDMCDLWVAWEAAPCSLFPPHCLEEVTSFHSLTVTKVNFPI